ncbi:hypothetical protein TanjilG_19801 [Lupinus angustifolius]|uniref:Uncharacterized protein n=1 Tax=Lupinus angustifolius TaxID=3871 RepID=A0A1J7HFF4_LUPAN|nr:hypothetical protein TanjilG_19801 [Lupinus angustifolius]
MYSRHRSPQFNTEFQLTWRTTSSLTIMFSQPSEESDNFNIKQHHNLHVSLLSFTLTYKLVKRVSRTEANQLSLTLGTHRHLS